MFGGLDVSGGSNQQKNKTKKKTNTYVDYGSGELQPHLCFLLGGNI